MSREEYFLPGTLPPPALSADYQTGTGRAYLPMEYSAWLAGSDHWLTGMVALRPRDPLMTPPASPPRWTAPCFTSIPTCATRAGG
ncbi:hypothetical protein [Verrucomicrobium spinosum]|uniref:hypothetical protein n=1 Tax=Verrucomicrobium spinosum TaxID=2736 RepID=UPI002109D1BE|nr:hypothetical protein [Verrucomicrobium spinosum]